MLSVIQDTAEFEYENRLPKYADRVEILQELQSKVQSMQQQFLSKVIPFC